MEEAPPRPYRLTYRSLFGREWVDVMAADAKDAERVFFATRNPELYRIFLVESLPCEEEGCGGADDGNEYGPADGAYSSKGQLAQEVLPGGRDVEHGVVEDAVLGSRSVIGDAGAVGEHKRVKHLLKSLFGEHD